MDPLADPLSELTLVGANVGSSQIQAIAVGAYVGDSVGDTVGDTVGDSVGGDVGESEGDIVGKSVGDLVGDDVGKSVGDSVGDHVGESVGAKVGGSVAGHASQVTGHSVLTCPSLTGFNCFLQAHLPRLAKLQVFLPFNPLTLNLAFVSSQPCRFLPLSALVILVSLRPPPELESCRR